MSGQIGLNPATMRLVEGGAVSEARLSLRHARRVLAVVTSTDCLCNLMTVICYVTSCEAAEAARNEFDSVLSSSLHQTDVATSCCYWILLLYCCFVFLRVLL